MDSPLQTAFSACISTSGPATTSPSDLSYSSGPSHTSSRNTSPDSASTGTLSHHSSPLVDLSFTAASIDYTPNTLLDQPLNMDKNSFQSVNDRRNKLVNERLAGAQYQHTQHYHGHQHQQHHLQQQQQQQQLTSPQLQFVRPSIQAPPGHHRSLTSANWRAQTPEDVIVPQPRTMYNPFDTTTTTAHHIQHPSSRNTPFPNTRVDLHHYHQHAASVTSYPTLSPTTDAQLDGSFAYCYDRGNGQYTRLIPADMLPPLQNIPAVQQGHAGMVVVPQPRGLPPNGHSSNTEPVAMRSRIDNIVAATPSTPTHLSPGSSNNPPPGHRRPKIYCDKWVHEGVCAFTQQGCKYKHEMPSDKITQHQLGLFHGYPQWWKKHQADLARQRDAPPAEGAKDGGQSNNSRPNNEQYLGHTSSPGARGGGLGLTSDAGGQLAWRPSSGESQALGRATISRSMVGSLRNTTISYGSPFGPIAPPARSNMAVNIPIDGVRASSMVQSTMEPHAMSQDTRRSSPVGTGITASSMLPTSNPFASLDILDDSSDQNANEELAYKEAPRRGGVHLS
ncbi:hypothetical protein GQX73_g2290 [Xylaria multiplex]|uniref:C3H1-type domain-containing protein n=1 Tax=Xylaria multiplex TaxID=323545 RepID=A0A7C8N922_9PEZI|nr:hypothetical protein GQX73_g2290 [Xylaria multiplex]